MRRFINDFSMLRSDGAQKRIDCEIGIRVLDLSLRLSFVFNDWEFESQKSTRAIICGFKCVQWTCNSFAPVT